MTDVPELDFTRWCATRTAAVAAALGYARACLVEARMRYRENPTPESRQFLVLVMACIEVGEAEAETCANYQTDRSAAPTREG